MPLQTVAMCHHLMMVILVAVPELAARVLEPEVTSSVVLPVIPGNRRALIGVLSVLVILLMQMPVVDLEVLPSLEVF